jgi:hypothetical protein
MNGVPEAPAFVHPEIRVNESCGGSCDQITT